MTYAYRNASTLISTPTLTTPTSTTVCQQQTRFRVHGNDWFDANGTSYHDYRGMGLVCICFLTHLHTPSHLRTSYYLTSRITSHTTSLSFSDTLTPVLMQKHDATTINNVYNTLVVSKTSLILPPWVSTDSTRSNKYI